MLINLNTKKFYKLNSIINKAKKNIKKHTLLNKPPINKKNLLKKQR